MSKKPAKKKSSKPNKAEKVASKAAAGAKARDEKRKAAELKKALKAHTLAKETLKGDLRTLVVDLFKSRPEDFRKMSESKQREIYAGIDDALDKSIAEAVQIIAAEGRTVCVGSLDSVTIKDGIKLAVTVAKRDAERHAICDAQGMEILIVVASGKPFSGEKEPTKVDPDQPKLPGISGKELAEQIAREQEEEGDDDSENAAGDGDEGNAGESGEDQGSGATGSNESAGGDEDDDDI